MRTIRRVAVGWIQFIEPRCIDRFRNDLIEIASIGTVLRQSSCPIESARSPGIASPRRLAARQAVRPAGHAASGAACARAFCRNRGQDTAQKVKRPALGPLSQWRRHSEDVSCQRPTEHDKTRRESMISRITLALALAITALASIPASASPQHSWQTASNCQEDLGYGRTSSWGCG
jgi:hypothetical protein